MGQLIVDIIGLLLGSGILGGGARGIATLTRLAIAAEQAGPAIVELGKGLSLVGATVQQHETTLAVHANQLAALGAPGSPTSATGTNGANAGVG